MAVVSAELSRQERAVKKQRQKYAAKKTVRKKKK